MKPIKAILRGLQIAVTAVLALLLAANLSLIAARLITGNPNARVLGFHWAVVMSGSMEPEISLDDLVISKKQKEYAPGDVITFVNGTSLTTHRIVGKTAAGFVTRGDANNSPDSGTVAPEEIVGRVVVTVPKIGLAVHFMKTPLGMMTIVLLALAVIELPHLLGQRSKVKDQRPQ